MVTVLRQGGLRVVIFLNDHPPPHVHVFGDGECKIVLVGDDGEPEVIRIIGATFAESRRALSLVREYQAMLLQRWNELHG